MSESEQRDMAFPAMLAGLKGLASSLRDARDLPASGVFLFMVGSDLEAYRAERDAARAEAAALRAEVERLKRVAWGVVHNARRLPTVLSVTADEIPTWAMVMDMTSQGSTAAKELCEEFGVDPDEKVIVREPEEDEEEEEEDEAEAEPTTAPAPIDPAILKAAASAISATDPERRRLTSVGVGFDRVVVYALTDYARTLVERDVEKLSLSVPIEYFVSGEIRFCGEDGA